VLSRRRHGLSGGAHRRLPHRDPVCPNGPTGPPTPTRRCTPSHSALWAVGQPAAARPTADAVSPRWAGRRWGAQRTASAKTVSACGSAGSSGRPSTMWPDRRGACGGRCRGESAHGKARCVPAGGRVRWRRPQA
jgi:hypothetical protein